MYNVIRHPPLSQFTFIFTIPEASYKKYRNLTCIFNLRQRSPQIISMVNDNPQFSRRLLSWYCSKGSLIPNALEEQQLQINLYFRINKQIIITARVQ